MKILVTGAFGVVGSEIRKLDSSLICPTRQELDITNISQIEASFEKYKPDVVLHLAAASRKEFDENPELGLSDNIIGTANIALACVKFDIKLVYISTDYVYVGDGPHKEDEPIAGPNPFSWSKIGGECATQIVPKHLILRPSMGGPAPFLWEKVYKEQYNSSLYFDEAAPLILLATKSNAEGIMNIGGPKGTLEEYARRTRFDVQTMPRPEWVPYDISMDLTKMQKELGIKDLKSVLRY